MGWDAGIDLLGFIQLTSPEHLPPAQPWPALQPHMAERQVLPCKAFMTQLSSAPMEMGLHAARPKRGDPGCILGGSLEQASHKRDVLLP